MSRGQRKIKLLYILDAFPDPQAGTEGQFWLLFSQLDRSRFEPAIVLLRPSPWLQEHVRDAPLRVLDIERLRSPASIRKILATVRWAKRQGFEMAHIFFNDSALVFPPLLKLAGIKVIVSRRDLGFWYTKNNLRLLRLNRHFVDAVVANAQAVKSVVQQQEGYAAKDIRVIHNGIRRSQSSPSPGSIRSDLGIEANAPLLMVVANLRPLKRIADVIMALAAQQGDGRQAHLLVAGEDRPGRAGDSHLLELEQLAQLQGVATRVHFLGKIDDPMPLLAQSSIGLLCSQTEGLSNAIIEYMLAGKPVICTDVGGNAELVQHEKNGFVVRMSDVGAIASAIEVLLADQVLTRRMGQASAQRARELFDPQVMAAAHVELYTEFH